MVWFLGILALLLVVAVTVLYIRTSRLLRRMDEMLTAAQTGDFLETRLDESRFSRLESRMYQYLISGASARRQVEAEKNAVKALVSDISHQTKTPLANVLLYTQLLAEDQTLSAQARAKVEAIGGQAEKLRFLIASLVKTSRLESGMVAVTPGENSLAELLLRVRETYLPTAQAKGIALTVQASEALTARFDPKWTEEALANLVDNAVKYTEKGGRVTILAAAYEMFVRVDVQDTGMGIAEEELTSVFQRFYRSPAAAEAPGVGIGLYLAREIVMRQGGYMKTASVLGEGSVFSVFLPRT